MRSEEWNVTLFRVGGSLECAGRNTQAPSSPFPRARLAHPGPCRLWRGPLANAHIEIPSNRSGYRHPDSYGDDQAHAHTDRYGDPQGDCETADDHAHHHASDDTYRDAYATGRADSDAKGSGDQVYCPNDEFLWIREHLMQALHDREAVRKQLHSGEPPMYSAAGMRLIANAKYSPAESTALQTRLFLSDVDAEMFASRGFCLRDRIADSAWAGGAQR